MGARRVKGTRGGWRPGAGRKPELREPVRFTLDFEGPDFAVLEKIARDREASIASVVREAVRSYLKRRGK